MHGLWDFSLVTAAPNTTNTGAFSELPLAAALAVLPMCLHGAFALRASQRLPLQPLTA